jgi:hypothetical protein
MKLNRISGNPTPAPSSSGVSRHSSRHSPSAVTLRQNPANRADGTGTVPATLNIRARFKRRKCPDSASGGLYEPSD